jgi:hypothetical protein
MLVIHWRAHLRARVVHHFFGTPAYLASSIMPRQSRRAKALDRAKKIFHASSALLIVGRLLEDEGVSFDVNQPDPVVLSFLHKLRCSNTNHNQGTSKGGTPRESCSQNNCQSICFWVGKQWRNVLQGSSIQANIAVSPINRTIVEWAVICDGAPTYHRAFRESKDRWGDN